MPLLADSTFPLREQILENSAQKLLVGALGTIYLAIFIRSKLAKQVFNNLLFKQYLSQY